MNYIRENGQTALKLNTVNVVEMSDGEMQGVRSFVDNPEGNKAAEELFRKLVAEYEKKSDDPPSDEEDFENYLEEGVYEDCSGYQLFITHSV